MNRINRASLIIAVLLLFDAPYTMSQTLQEMVEKFRVSTSLDNSVIVEAVQPSLSIIRQQYRLKRNNDYYGRHGKPYYGETYSLGVKISGSTLLQREVLFPWENDADYHRVNADGTYEPVTFVSKQRLVCDSIWKIVEFDFHNYTRPWSADNLLFDSQDRISDFGLDTDMTEGQKKGYLIWVYSTSQPLDSTMQVHFKQTSLSLQVNTDSLAISVKPEGISNVLGGLFVVPKVVRAGYIKIELVGVVTRKGKDGWVLELFAVNNDIEATEHQKKNSKPDKKNKAKEKKETDKEHSVEDTEPTPIK